MPSDLKRVLMAAALAAAAFNATAPASRAGDMPGAPTVHEGADAAPHSILANHRPSRIRIGKCGEERDLPVSNLLEI